MGTVLKIYSVKKDFSTWLNFIRKAKNIHSELQTCTFVVDLEWKLFLTYVVTFHQRGLLCTCTNLQLFVKLEWKLGKMYMWNFTKKARNVGTASTNGIQLADSKAYNSLAAPPLPLHPLCEPGLA